MPFVADLLQITAETVRNVLPIAACLTLFQLFVLRRSLPNPKRLMLGLTYVLAGLSLFLMGLEQALFPLGKTMAAQLTSLEFLGLADEELLFAAGPREFLWVYAFAFAVGFSTTIAEPALIAVALKAEELSAGGVNAWGLRMAVALGVAIGLSLGTFRIVTGAPIHLFIMTGYAVVVVQTLFAPRLIVPLAYDSGGVTTSTVTVPLVAALGLGLAESLPGRSALVDGFGLIAFASLFPIITVMAYAQFSHWWNARGGSRSAQDTPDRLASKEGRP